jgi:hypothetical protein
MWNMEVKVMPTIVKCDHMLVTIILEELRRHLRQTLQLVIADDGLSGSSTHLGSIT